MFGRFDWIHFDPASSSAPLAVSLRRSSTERLGQCGRTPLASTGLVSKAATRARSGRDVRHAPWAGALGTALYGEGRRARGASDTLQGPPRVDYSEVLLRKIVEKFH